MCEAYTYIHGRQNPPGWGGLYRVRGLAPSKARPPLGSAGLYRANRAIQLPRLRDTRVSTLRDLSASLTYGYMTAQHR